MRNYFARYLKRLSHNESIEKTCINDHINIKLNTSIEIPHNQKNIEKTHQKLTFLLTNGQLTQNYFDQHPTGNCRSKSSDCQPALQPSDFTKKILEPYISGNLAKHDFKLTGVNLCAHTKAKKPNQTHVEFLLRSNIKNLANVRLVINVHVQFTTPFEFSHRMLHQKLHKNLAAALSSSHAITSLLGTQSARALQLLDQNIDIAHQPNHTLPIKGFIDLSNKAAMTTNTQHGSASRNGMFSSPNISDRKSCSCRASASLHFY